MKAILTCVLAVSAIGSSAGRAREQSPNEFERMDTPTKRATIRELERQSQTSRVDPSVLPIVLLGISEPDAETKVRAVITLNHVIHPPSSAIDNADAIRVLRQRRDVHDLLIRCSGDGDIGVRGGCVDAMLFLADALEPQVVDHLVALYHRETYSRIQNVLLDGLSRKAPRSPEVQGIIIDALSSPVSRTRVVAAVAAGRTKTKGALPTIVTELQSGSDQTRVDFARALAAYGVMAKPHLPVLEAVAASETRSAQKKEIEVAIATIRNSREQDLLKGY